jgi:hypothetical protein
VNDWRERSRAHPGRIEQNPSGAEANWTLPQRGGPLSAKLIVNPERGARCAIRDTGAAGIGRYQWTVAVFGEIEPVAGRAGELVDARAAAEVSLAGVTDWRGLPSGVDISFPARAIANQRPADPRKA